MSLPNSMIHTPKSPPPERQHKREHGMAHRDWLSEKTMTQHVTFSYAHSSVCSTALLHICEGLDFKTHFKCSDVYLNTYLVLCLDINAHKMKTVNPVFNSKMMQLK